MAVLIEGISVVVKVQSMLDAFDRDWNAVFDVIPNKTLCSDTELARIGFMTPVDVEAFVNVLQIHGLQFIEEGRCVDIVVVDQMLGVINLCDWVDFGVYEIAPGQLIAACRLVDSEFDDIQVPDDWSYSRSLSRTSMFVPSGQMDKTMKFLRNEGGVDVYENLMTGREVYVGRPSIN